MARKFGCRVHTCQGCGLVKEQRGLPDDWIGCGWSDERQEGAEWCKRCQDNGTYPAKCYGRAKRSRRPVNA